MMTAEQVKKYTIHRVRECTGNQDILRKRWRNGDITTDDFLRHNALLEREKLAFQRMCKAVIEGHGS